MEAAELFSCALQIDPLAQEAYTRLMGAYLMLGDYESIYEQLTRFSKFDDLPPELEPLIQASILFEQGEYAEALPFSLEAIELNPDIPVSYMATGAIYARQRLYTTALPYLNQAIEIAADSPDSYNYFYERGFVHYQLGDIVSAKADFEQARSLEPEIVTLTLEAMLRYSRLGLEDALSSAIERLAVFNLLLLSDE